MIGTTFSLREGLVWSGVPDVTPVRDVPVRVAPSWLLGAWQGDIAGMTLPRVVYLSPRSFEAALAGNAAELLAHEAAHVGQWRRLGIPGFIFRYLSDYLRGRMAGLPHATAYRAISLEREARAEAAAAIGRDA